MAKRAWKGLDNVSGVVWKVRVDVSGFETFLMVEGSETEMRLYLDSEVESYISYIRATEDEIKGAKAMGMKIYMAPHV